MARLAIVALAGLTLVLAAPVRAQESDPEAEALSLEALLDIVVTATLRKQSELDAPASITVVKAAEIRARGYRTLKAVMNDVPGFNDVADTNEEIVAVRGVFTSTTNKILILVNGHRMNDLMLGRYNVDQFLGLGAVEQVEFIRGPASALYGTGALVGIVNVITRRGAELGGAELAITAGPRAHELSGSFGAPVAGYDLFFNFTYLNATGEERAQDARLDVTPNGADQAPGRIYLGRYPENLSALFTLRSESSSLALRAAHFRRILPRAASGSFYDYEREPWKPAYTENDFFADYAVTWQLGEGSKLRLNPSVHFFSYYEQSFMVFGANRAPPLGERSGMQGEFNDYELKLTLENQLLPELNLITGVDALLASFYRSDSVGIADGRIQIRPAGYTPTGRWLTIGVLGQAVYRPAFARRALTLTLGARYDTFQKEAAEVTPRVGLVYRARPGLAVKLLYGRSYLAPMWAHKRANDGQFLGNPNLRRESFHGSDLIVTWVGRTASASVDLYLNKTVALINGVRQGGPTGTLFLYDNSGESLYAGAEAAGEVELAPRIRVSGSYAYLRPLPGGTSAGLLEGGRIAEIAPHTLRYGLRIGPFADLQLSLWGRAYSATATRDPVTGAREIPAVALFDASLLYERRSFSLQLIGTNLSNRGYERGGSAIRPLARESFNLEAAAAVRF